MCPLLVLQVRSRVAKFQRRDAMPVDRPCGLRLSDAASDDEIVRLLRLHDEAVRCVVPPDTTPRA